jgi:hypothetical protein
MAAGSVFAAVVLACGGGKGATDAPKTPENPAASAASGTPEAVPSTTTTTTMTLGDGGDLQGTKLSSSTTTTQTAPVGTAGAAGSDGGTVQGHEPGRSQKDIQTIILARRDEARACYDKALKDHPGIEGNIDIKWTIDPKGAVTETSVDEGKSDIHEPSVGKCIQDIIKQIHFSVSGKGLETRAHYPFNFHPRHGGAPQQ